ncbi:uncharacterized protein MYCFIDRAFT_83316 [Pseudocercospora fijiensis CIRAD86]|uniref:Large ribosomal subunit protein mL50 n=1 Tax=Pseudocercospora fijiensis (strain CIRAD86) TaxID=383855 RepID=M2ZZ17_PSEFD|nr:uncharacterized protein MYCFIDRAFT_83316 [Pseudocercospora fijiensis CIRAD86]EME77386.1 hypothetical protein MYCFIDRAFT_83316 [Pseudocercospora fijiensis CIRAD86]
MTEPELHETAIETKGVLELADTVNSSLPAGALIDVDDPNKLTVQITWNAKVKVKKYAFDGSFSVHLFTGYVKDDQPERYMTKKNEVGFAGIFARSAADIENCSNCQSQRDNDIVIEDVVPITTILYDYLESEPHSRDLIRDGEHQTIRDLTAESVVPFLTEQLHWRIIDLASEALRLATEPSRQPYVCRSCMAQAARQFHTTRQRDAQREVPYYQRLKDSIFGKKQPEKKKKQDDGDVSDPEAEREEYHTRKTIMQNGVEYEVAQRVDPSKRKDYLPATTWHGLERVGNREWAKARADQGEVYEGFMRETGANLDSEEELLELEKKILETVHRETPSKAGQQDLTKINITNPDLKLAIVREVIRFTGKRVPDQIISKARTAEDIFRAVQAKEPPKKLKDDPRVQELGASEKLPNVKVYSQKRTSVHKEMDIGRWKVIEDELKLRNLPVFGTNFPYAKEGVRMHEKKVDWRKHGYVKYKAKKAKK